MTKGDPDPRGDFAARLECRLSAIGLMVRGATHFDDDGPELSNGETAGSLVLIGHAGSSFWPYFDGFRLTYSGPDALDTWTRQVIQPIAERVQATALFPFDRPWWPFQQWAVSCEGLKPSPLGILIHPEYGVWHGYRAALAFAEKVRLSPNPTMSHPCSECVDRPCIAACPVGAVGDGGFDVGLCRTHLARPEGAGCHRHGCLSRNACPVGRGYQYNEPHRRFLMRALKVPL